MFVEEARSQVKSSQVNHVHVASRALKRLPVIGNMYHVTKFLGTSAHRCRKLFVAHKRVFVRCATILELLHSPTTMPHWIVMNAL